MKNIEKALGGAIKDDALIRHFLTVWPVVESILEAFSKATRLPIFAYLSKTQVFQSSMDTMPGFCAAMLGSHNMAVRCVHDGQRRADRAEPDHRSGMQLCHAGMINGRCEIELGIGSLVVLYGSRKAMDTEAIRRRDLVKRLAFTESSEVFQVLEAADNAEAGSGDIEASDVELMNAISVTITKLLEATVGFRSLTINMAHELSLLMLGMGLLAKELEAAITSVGLDSNPALGEVNDINAHILSETQLGLYIVRNFLSYASETRYRQAVKPKFSEVNLEDLIREAVHLYRYQAATKELAFELVGLDALPKIFGVEMELRRAFHNVLSNAIKYSYRSIPEAQRVIRIKGKVPYDPGFRDRRFAICFENYGLGLSKDELRSVLKPGFRGHQAVAEVPIGAGIGLSETLKIMQVHGGDVKVRSRNLHHAEAKVATYLSSIDLIFPYSS